MSSPTIVFPLPIVRLVVVLNNEIKLRPIHYACVSGGKDSLFMLNHILHNLDTYPLDAVVHYELEIDWEWVKAVVDLMEERCKAAGIPFYRVKPGYTWQELYEKWDLPSRRVRWCNKPYKISAENKIKKWIKEQNCRPIAYIGFCADETKRFKYELGEWKNQECCYPLAEDGFTEDIVLEWARTQSIFQNWYVFFRRQGCKICPLASRKELAYLLYYEPETFEWYMDLARKHDANPKFPTQYFEPYSVDYVENSIRTKWLPILLDELKKFESGKNEFIELTNGQIFLNV